MNEVREAFYLYSRERGTEKEVRETKEREENWDFLVDE